MERLRVTTEMAWAVDGADVTGFIATATSTAGTATCQVDAPELLLRVEDDGRGLLPPRDGSFGLTIMQERAERAGCSLTIAPRHGGGTTVEVLPWTALEKRSSTRSDRGEDEHDSESVAR